mgnify:CR=1 FL=1
MANYLVIMGQAVTVPNLTGNILLTGRGNVEDSIQSCSAVIFFNATSKAAGLYHYPAKALSKRPGSRTLLEAIRDEVVPTEAYIAYGVLGFMNLSEENILPTDTEHEDLRSFVLRLLPEKARLRRLPARSRFASIRVSGGEADVGDSAPLSYTDLRDQAAGTYTFGKIFWDE